LHPGSGALGRDVKWGYGIATLAIDLLVAFRGAVWALTPVYNTTIYIFKCEGMVDYAWGSNCKLALAVADVEPSWAFWRATPVPCPPWDATIATRASLGMQA